MEFSHILWIRVLVQPKLQSDRVGELDNGQSVPLSADIQSVGQFSAEIDHGPIEESARDGARAVQ